MKRDDILYVVFCLLLCKKASENGICTLPDIFVKYNHGELEIFIKICFMSPQEKLFSESPYNSPTCTKKQKSKRLNGLIKLRVAIVLTTHQIWPKYWKPLFHLNPCSILPLVSTMMVGTNSFCTYTNTNLSMCRADMPGKLFAFFSHACNSSW